MTEPTTGRRPWVYAALAAAVFAGAGALWLARGGSAIAPSIGADEARPIAEAFLADVRTGKPDRVDAAWESTSAEFKSGQGKEQFRKFVRANKVLAAPAEFQGCEMTEANGVRVARCRFRTASGAPLAVLLGPDRSAWKVERLVLE